MWLKFLNHSGPGKICLQVTIHLQPLLSSCLFVFGSTRPLSLLSAFKVLFAGNGFFCSFAWANFCSFKSKLTPPLSQAYLQPQCRAFPTHPKHTPRLWTGRLNVIKMAVLLRLIHRLKAIPIWISADFFVETNELILKFLWNCRVSGTDKTE